MGKEVKESKGSGNRKWKWKWKMDILSALGTKTKHLLASSEIYLRSNFFID
jgi:hypothetical protein